MTTPRLALIGGSGLYHMDGVELREERHVPTPFGDPSDLIRFGHWDGRPIVFLPRHGRHHTIMPSEINYRANLWALKSLGIEQIIAVSAVGSMKEDIRPGDFVLVDQLIDRTTQRATTFFGEGCVAHVSFADPICEQLRGVLAQAAEGLNVRLHRQGTYVCIEGPAYSSRAESQLYRSWGVDVIGMTAYQEARLAREAEIAYAVVALATDYDCWHQSEADVTTDAVMAVIKQNVCTVQQLLRRALPLIPVTPNPRCAEALRGAIMTPPEHIAPSIKERLAPIVGKYTS